MERRDFIKTAIFTAGVLATSSLYASEKPNNIKIDFNYKINFNSANDIKLWIPLPLENAYQKINNIYIEGNQKFYKSYYKNHSHILYAQYNQHTQEKFINIKMDLSLNDFKANLKDSPESFRNSSRYIRTDGFVEKLASGLKGINDNATLNNIYKYLSHGFDYENARLSSGIRTIMDKKGERVFGGEDISINTLFVSLCRACNIPAREAIGIDFKDLKNPYITSKAEIFIKNSWEKYDLLSAIENKNFDGKGIWDKKFVLLNYCRDIEINKSLVANFGEIFGLVDGDRLSYYDKSHWNKKINIAV